MLLLLNESRDGRIFRTRCIHLGPEPITIGRDGECDYQLEPIKFVSRVQATIEPFADKWIVRDGKPGKPTITGIYHEKGRICGTIVLEVGSKIDLVQGQTYCVELVATDVSEDELRDVERDTVEYPLHDLVGEISTLKDAVSGLKGQVGELLSSQACNQALLQSITHLEEQIGHLDRRLTGESLLNAGQDKQIKRVLAGLAAALVVTGSYSIGANRDVITQALGVFQIVAGLSGVIAGGKKND